MNQKLINLPGLLSIAIVLLSLSTCDVKALPGTRSPDLIDAVVYKLTGYKGF